jgi:beta-galactosidase
VKVYSNCESIELFLNGRSIGAKKADDRIFIWEDLPLRDGRNDVRAVGERGGRTYRDQVQWEAQPQTTSGQQ